MAYESHPKILSGRAHPTLAQEVAKLIGGDVVKIQLSTFANGEIVCRLEETLQNEDVWVMQSHGGSSVNDALMEQLIMIDAAKRAAAGSITAVCPFLGYTRQDRQESSGASIGARLVLDMLATAGADRVFSVDLHTDQVQGFFDGPLFHVSAQPLIAAYIKELKLENLTVVSPDTGRVKLAERYAAELGADIAVVRKRRADGVEALALIGEVSDKTCLIVDDMIDSSQTLIAATELLFAQGSKKVYGAATHGIFSDGAVERIDNSALSQVIVTNTLPKNPTSSQKFVELSIAPLIAQLSHQIS